MYSIVGLINNIYYVIILTAALDLVGPSIPKATVLLSCIVPGLATKVITPYFIQLVPYSVRIICFVLLTTAGMLAVAQSPDSTDPASLSSKIAGIILANISCGAGEVSFVAMTHYYGPFSLAAWGSGTGMAGLLGAGAYAFATNTLGMTVRRTLLSSLVLSLLMLLTYLYLLPLEPLHNRRQFDLEYRRLDAEHPDDQHEESTLDSSSCGGPQSDQSMPSGVAHHLSDKLRRTKVLVLPYMLPLFLVYLAEYTINQGVAPTLLFPLDQSPFERFRDFYPAYATIYQLGVFISRSSLPFFRLKALYPPSWLQVLNLVVLTIHSMTYFLPTVWIVFAIVFWEGLLGGSVYVSTFAAVREEVSEPDREFSLGAVTLADSFGIFCAGLVGAVLEPALCSWQVSHGRDWCRQS